MNKSGAPFFVTTLPIGTIGDLLAGCTAMLESEGVSEPAREAREIVAAVLDVPKFWAVYQQGNVHQSNITRPKAHLSLPVRWCQVLEQLDFMTIRRFQYSELQFSTCDSGDFFSHFASLVRSMRKLKAENIAPECE